MLLSKTAKLKVENSAQTTSRFPTVRNRTLCIQHNIIKNKTLSINDIKRNVTGYYAECECHYAECHYAKCLGAGYSTFLFEKMKIAIQVP